MILARFVWTNRGARRLAKEVEKVLSNHVFRIESINIERGFFGLRWLVVVSFKVGTE